MPTYRIALANSIENIEAPNRVEAIRIAEQKAKGTYDDIQIGFGGQQTSTSKKNYVKSVDLVSGDVETPFVADEQSYAPTVSGIEAQAAGQINPLTGEQDFVDTRSPLFAAQEELSDLEKQALMTEVQEKERRRQEEKERQRRLKEEEDKRKAEAEAKAKAEIEKNKAAEEKRRQDSAKNYEAQKLLKTPVAIPEGDLEGTRAEGTRALVLQRTSEDESTIYRAYEYTIKGKVTIDNPSGEEVVETRYFVVNGDELSNVENARANEFQVTASAWDAKKSFKNLELNDIADFIIEPGETGGLDIGSVLGFGRNYKAGKVGSFVKLEPGGLTVQDVIPDWFAEVMRLNGNSIVQNEETGRVRIFKGDLPSDVKGKIPEVAQYLFNQGDVSETQKALDVFDPEGTETYPEYVARMQAAEAGDKGPFEDSTDPNTEVTTGKETVKVEESSDSGSSNEFFNNLGINVGAFGVIPEDMPGLPEGFFERTDWFVDKTTVERDINLLFTIGEAQYQVSDAGIRVDSKGQPEYTEYITTERVENPEIRAQLEAYALALKSKTDLQGSMATVLDAHIKATDGLGIGRDAFNATEIANLRNNLTLIGASEGLLSYGYDPDAVTYRYNPDTSSYDAIEGGFTQKISEPLQQQRLQEIQYAQRPDISQQVVDIYSNPVAYGLLQQTDEGKKFLQDLTDQAGFDPFSKQKDSSGQAVVAPTSMQPFGGETSTLSTLGGANQNGTVLSTLEGQGPLNNTYIPPSAQEYSRMTEVPRGIELARAAGANILGQEELEKKIRERTPFGESPGYGVFAPFVTGRSKEGDPFSGAVKAAANPGSVSGTGPARGG